MSKKSPKFFGSIANEEHIAATLELNIPHLFTLDHEEIWLLVGDEHYRVFEISRMAIGDHECVENGWQESLKKIRQPGVRSFAVVHNHPSGEHPLSMVDLVFLYDLWVASKALQVEFRDFVIVAKDKDAFWSARASGMLQGMSPRSLMIRILESPMRPEWVTIDPVGGEIQLGGNGEEESNHQTDRGFEGR